MHELVVYLRVLLLCVETHTARHALPSAHLVSLLDTGCGETGQEEGSTGS